MRTQLLASLLLVISALPVDASHPLIWPRCRPEQTQVLLLGVFHMADEDAMVDVTTPRRQQELDDVARRLAAFKPSKVAVERPSTAGETLNTSYAGYLNGEPLAKSEVAQVGFRVARLAGLSRISQSTFA